MEFLDTKIKPSYFSVDPKGARGTEESCCKFGETFCHCTYTVKVMSSP